MRSEFSRASFAYTIKRFWNRQRVVKLFSFSLLLANLTIYSVREIALRTIRENRVQQNHLTYKNFANELETERAALKESAENSKQISIYTIALESIRQRAKSEKLGIIAIRDDNSQSVKTIFSKLRGRKQGMLVTELRGNWVRSYYKLATKPESVLVIASDIKSERQSWQIASIITGCYAFLILFAFGWFWTRSLEKPQTEESLKLAEVEKMLVEVLHTIEKAKIGIDNLESEQRRKYEAVVSALRYIEEVASNGMLQATKTSDVFEKFYAPFAKIKQAASFDQRSGRSSDLSSGADILVDLIEKIHPKVTRVVDDSGPHEPVVSASRVATGRS